MNVRYYETERSANIQARVIANVLGFYISVERNNKGYYLSTKYAQGLRASS